MKEWSFLTFIRNRLISILFATSLILPISTLYILHPDSFQLVWEARTPYIIFLWFFGLELALSWKTLNPTLNPNLTTRMTFTLILLAIPTVFILAISFSGLHDAIITLGKMLGDLYVTFGTWFIDVSWPISFEYLIFTTLYTVNLLVIYGVSKRALASV